jgi:hypothetical protein
LALENMCLRDGINPPLGSVHLGDSFFGDEETFQVKAKELIEIEIARKAETEARIIKQQEKANQEKIDQALQDERNKVAREALAARFEEEQAAKAKAAEELSTKHAEAQAEKQQSEFKARSEPVTAQQVDNAIAAEKKRLDDIKNPPVIPASNDVGMISILVEASFVLSIPRSIGKAAFIESFKNDLPATLKDHLVSLNVGKA